MLRSTLLLTLTAIALSAQAPATFDVATIKPTEGPIPGIPPALGRQETTADTLISRHTPLAEVIRRAFDIPDLQLAGVPDWVRQERFDIVGKSAKPATDAQLWLMVQPLLEERLHLKFHREPKEVSGLAMVVGKNGHKLKPTEGGSNNFQMGGGVFNGHNVPVSRIAGLLTAVTRTPILDATGLEGTYDFKIDTQEYAGAALPTVVQEGLGLKLEPRKFVVQMLIIDHIERPGEN